MLSESWEKDVIYTICLAVFVSFFRNVNVAAFQSSLLSLNVIEDPDV